VVWCGTHVFRGGVGGGRSGVRGGGCSGAEGGAVIVCVLVRKIRGEQKKSSQGL
jgi:hypothetical protein